MSSLGRGNTQALLQKQMSFASSHMPKSDETDALEGINIHTSTKHTVSREITVLYTRHIHIHVHIL